jgi:2',3'-cyclic-nucleotide 2'-phosphodiesterase (5'-nucleotidase family)
MRVTQKLPTYYWHRGKVRLTTAIVQDHNAFVLFSGDAFNPSLMSTITSGAQMPPVLNQVGVQAACVGNHDLDFGISKFEELARKCKFPWLMANVLLKETEDLFPACERCDQVDFQCRN